MNYFYMLQLFLAMELVDAYSFWANRVEIINQDCYIFIHHGTKLNKDIPINEAFGVHSGHIQTTHYSSEGEDKSIYNFCITI